MKKRTILFNGIGTVLFVILFIKGLSFLESTPYRTQIYGVWKGITSLNERIQSKSVLNKNFKYIKKSTQFFKKSYKYIIAGGAGLTYAANKIIYFKRKKDD